MHVNFGGVYSGGGGGAYIRGGKRIFGRIITYKFWGAYIRGGGGGGLIFVDYIRTFTVS